MLATDFIKEYPGACEKAVEWINSLGEGMTAEEAWEICPNGSWMAWIASRVGVPEEERWEVCPDGSWRAWIASKVNVPEEERWVWVDLTRLWVADILDKEGVEHKLRECSPVVDVDSAYAVSIAADSANNSSSVYSYAAIRIAYLTVNTTPFSVNRSAEYAADIIFIRSVCTENAAKSAADMIRKRVKNPFRRDLC